MNFALNPYEMNCVEEFKENIKAFWLLEENLESLPRTFLNISGKEVVYL